MGSFSQPLATVYGACIAALVTIIGLGVNAWVTAASARRAAIRELLANDLPELGGCLYLILAMSKKMLNAKSDEKYKEFHEKALLAQKDLDKMRLKVKYSLWGLDAGFIALRSIPFYITHCRTGGDAARGGNLITLGTKLRQAIDLAIFYSYQSGRPPCLLHRKRVQYYGYCLRKLFVKSKLVNDETQEA